MYLMDAGRLAILTHLLANEEMDLTIRGFQNDVDVFSVSPFGVRTENPLIECTFNGYLPLDMVDFSPPLLNSEGVGFAFAADLKFSAAVPVDPQTCFGIFITMKDALGILCTVFAQRFRDPQTITANGDEVNFSIGIFDDDIPYVVTP